VDDRRQRGREGTGQGRGRLEKERKGGVFAGRAVQYSPPPCPALPPALPVARKEAVCVTYVWQTLLKELFSAATEQGRAGQGRTGQGRHTVLYSSTQTV
jgi:hypothetical protein